MQSNVLNCVGDGKASNLKEKGIELKDGGMGWGKSLRAKRKMRRYEDDFDETEFAEKAVDIYIKAHEALAEGDTKTLHDTATEKAFPEMMHNVNKKSIRWSFIKNLEAPKTVQIRANSVMKDADLFAQITVRIHSRQTLAVYDRFGRLIHGHPLTAKDVLEYVVFEKHITDTEGSWRIHGKIIPEWAPNRDGSKLTHVVRNDVEIEEEDVVDDDDDVDEERAKGKKEDEEDDENVVLDKYGRKMKKL